MVITLCMIEIFSDSTQGSFQCFRWSSHYGKWGACLASSSKPSGGCFCFWHDTRIIIKQCTGRRRLARESPSLATEQTLQQKFQEELLIFINWNILNIHFLSGKRPTERENENEAANSKKIHFSNKRADIIENCYIGKKHKLVSWLENHIQVGELSWKKTLGPVQHPICILMELIDWIELQGLIRLLVNIKYDRFFYEFLFITQVKKQTHSLD